MIHRDRFTIPSGATQPRPSAGALTTERPRIGFLSSFDLEGVHARSSVQGAMARALQEHVGDVVPLAPAVLPWDGWRRRIDRFNRRVGLPRLATRATLERAMALGRFYSQQLRECPVDVVFAPKAAAEVAFLESNAPVVYTSDATYALLDGYYPSALHLSSKRARARREIERLAIHRADALVFRSWWAARSALSDYGAEQERLWVLRTGPNFAPEDLLSAEEVLARRGGPRPLLRLLLVGVDWYRKGGSIAVDALRRLRAQGVPAELTIVGCRPPVTVEEPGLRLLPFLDKGDPDDRARLIELYLRADLLLHPARADCSPGVLVEANAFGLPVLATRTGGIPELVHDGENGYTLPPGATGDDYAAMAEALWLDPNRQHALFRSSRLAYERRLTWSAWGQRLREEVIGPLAAARCAQRQRAEALRRVAA